MAKVTIYDMTGKSVGERELNDAIFAVTPNKAVLHEVVKNYLANQRQGTQSTLTRTEVSGGGKKPWRQKGTGHARQGSTRAPQWTHGGVALGPKPRSYRINVPKAIRRLAMKSALSCKVTDDEMIVLDKIELAQPKTKLVAQMLKALGSEKKALIVTENADQAVVRAAGNIPGVKVAHVGCLNVLDILNCDKFIISQDAVKKVEFIYSMQEEAE